MCWTIREHADLCTEPVNQLSRYSMGIFGCISVQKKKGDKYTLAVVVCQIVRSTVYMFTPG